MTAIVPIRNDGSYTDVDERWRERFWEFLNRPGNTRLLEGAVRVTRPPAWIIEKPLLDEYPELRDDPKNIRDRKKQLLGFYIRVVLESRGYSKTGRSKTFSGIGYFTRAATYWRADLDAIGFAEAVGV